MKFNENTYTLRQNWHFRVDDAFLLLFYVIKQAGTFCTTYKRCSNQLPRSTWREWQESNLTWGNKKTKITTLWFLQAGLQNISRRMRSLSRILHDSVKIDPKCFQEITKKTSQAESGSHIVYCGHDGEILAHLDRKAPVWYMRPFESFAPGIQIRLLSVLGSQ